MNVRKAKREDMAQLVELCRAHAIYEKTTFDSKNIEAKLSKYILDPQFGIKCLVVEEDSELVGYATYMKQFSTWEGSFYVYLDCLYLKQETRGKGIGGKLMKRIKEYALSEDCMVIQWQTPDFNIDAIRFYEKIGGKSNTKERFYWKV